MLSDRFRFWKIGAALAALVVLVAYAAWVGPKAYPGYHEAQLDPATFAGRTIFFGGDVVVVGPDDGDDGGEFTFRTWDGFVVAARGRIGRDQAGFRISGTAVFRGDGTLDVVQYHVYRYRITKNLLAVLPLLAVAFFFFRTYAFDRRAFVFRARSR
jgi:hypothetical protein